MVSSGAVCLPCPLPPSDATASRLFSARHSDVQHELNFVGRANFSFGAYTAPTPCLAASLAATCRRVISSSSRRVYSINDRALSDGRRPAAMRCRRLVNHRVDGIYTLLHGRDVNSEYSTAGMCIRRATGSDARRTRNCSAHKFVSADFPPDSTDSAALQPPQLRSGPTS